MILFSQVIAPYSFSIGSIPIFRSCTPFPSWRVIAHSGLIWIVHLLVIGILISVVNVVPVPNSGALQNGLIKSIIGFCILGSVKIIISPFQLDDRVPVWLGLNKFQKEP